MSACPACGGIPCRCWGPEEQARRKKARSDRDAMGMPRIPDSWWLVYVVLLLLGFGLMIYLNIYV